MHQASFTPLYRPERVGWVFPKIKSVDDFLNKLPSKSTRKFLSHSDHILEKYSLRYEHSLCDERTYDQWLINYQSFTQDQHYKTIATKSWYEEAMAQSRPIYVTQLFHGAQVIAGTISLLKGNRATIAFKWNQKNFIFDEPNGSVGVLIEFLTISQLLNYQPDIISGGSSHNLFGVINKPGYLILKASIGYSPFASTKGVFVQDSPEIPNETGLYVFLTQTPEYTAPVQLHFFASPACPQPHPEIQRYFEIVTHPVPKIS